MMKKYFWIFIVLLWADASLAITSEEAIRKVQNAPSVYGNTLDCVRMAMITNNAAVVGTGFPGPQALGWTAEAGKEGQVIVRFHYISKGTYRETATWILKPLSEGKWKVVPHRGLGGGFAPVCTKR